QGFPRCANADTVLGHLRKLRRTHRPNGLVQRPTISHPLSEFGQCLPILLRKVMHVSPSIKMLKDCQAEPVETSFWRSVYCCDRKVQVLVYLASHKSALT